MQSETKTQTTDNADTLRMAERTEKRSREELLRACRQAVDCLERYAADARREVERAAELDPDRLAGLPSALLSASTWGAANAASELSTATRMAAQYMNAIGMIEALKGGAR